MQRRSAEVLGAAWSAELATGHLPMLEDPAGLVAAIECFRGARPAAVPG
ncbi:hypothetical protein [Nocardioides sp. zg-DK7169]|nr:hypothetical protein [Nocardioides sp. zg-DK7169]NPC97008.1 hypothetical protein [Nocardioides sp. zg-DK7169]